MKNAKSTVVFLAAMACWTGSALASSEPSAWTTQPTNTEKANAKLGFGLKNTFFGWLDVIYEPYFYHAEGKNVIAGIGKGFADAIVNTAGGAVHLATFPVPVDLPLPDGGVARTPMGG